jgi:hypothetical protein
MAVLNGNFALSCGPGTHYPYIHVFQCMLERTDAKTNEVLEPIKFVLAYLTVLPSFTARNVFGSTFLCMDCIYWRKDKGKQTVAVPAIHSWFCAWTFLGGEVIETNVPGRSVTTLHSAKLLWPKASYSDEYVICLTVHHWYKWYKHQLDATITAY